MLALCLMLSMTHMHYTQNYAGVIGGSLSINAQRPIEYRDRGNNSSTKSNG